MENKVYIISFGDSTKYRFTPNEENCSLSEIRSDIKAYLSKKYPLLGSPELFDSMTVTEVDGANKAEYEGYPEFNDESINEIKHIVSTEIDSRDSLRRLNSNAPWNDAD